MRRLEKFPASVVGTFVCFLILAKSQMAFSCDEANETIILTQEELDRQIEDMDKFLTTQMEAPNGWNNTDESTKANSTEHGVPDMSIFRQIFAGFGENVKRDSLCAACQVYTGVLMHQINRRNQSRENLEHFTIFTCRFFRLADPDVCQGVVQRLGPTFYWIVKARKQGLSPAEFCGVTFQSLGCRISRRRNQNSEFNWEIDPVNQLVPLPPWGGSGNELDRVTVDPVDIIDSLTPMTAKRLENRPLKILHLADLHIDLDYAPGTAAECENDVLCCQERFGYPEEGEVGAGYYGDNRKCDAPLSMLHLALGHIRKEHTDIDLIYMTGDLVPHNIWYTDEEENKEIIRLVSKIMYEYFPNTKLIPCLGNHEAHPVNLYSPTSRTFNPPESNPIPTELRQDWVYETAYEAWKQWIPSEERENFLRAGFYVVEINEKMRAIVVNTNVCYGFNMWQTYSPRDPADMLQWLQNELYITAKGGKTAHIIGHVPPGHEDCSKAWSREFYKIVARYKTIVTGQFYGHTHYDEFRILHDPDNHTQPINVMWIGPSLTPYRIFNPGYRIYHMDANESTYGNIVDHETWVYDLDKANEDYRQMYGNGTEMTTPEVDDRIVQWFQLYQATKAYNISDTLPTTMRGFVSRMAKEKETFDLFYQHYYKAIDPSFSEKDPCDTVCRKRILCGIVRSYYDDDEGHVECNNVQREVDGIVLPLRTLDQRRRYIWL
ncbi:Sphingomyelin phosphodiesterase [Orchesella cincta]|uniref:Sphingomyelin phosphodiesterase n=1 Tax=Orchesella cincta TaxID=48709 RepID=A0A1D2MQ89_ORCCI|nr:Sphingomyelin phosphodiesterase [Orchesella cincta]